MHKKIHEKKNAQNKSAKKIVHKKSMKKNNVGPPEKNPRKNSAQNISAKKIVHKKNP